MTIVTRNPQIALHGRINPPGSGSSLTPPGPLVEEERKRTGESFQAGDQPAPAPGGEAAGADRTSTAAAAGSPAARRQ